MKWKCLRCEVIFDDDNKGCDCEISPSPWTPLNDKLEEIPFDDWYQLKKDGTEGSVRIVGFQYGGEAKW